MSKKNFTIAVVTALFVIVFSVIAQEPGKTQVPSTEQQLKEKTKPVSTPQTKKEITGPKHEAENVPEITCIAPKTIEKGKIYWYARRDTWMKDTPSAEGKKIYKVKANSVFVQLEKSEKGWLKLEGMINDTTKVQGYIYKAFLKRYPPTPEKEKTQPKTKEQHEEKSSQ